METMITRHTIHSLPWLDVFSPTKEDLRTLSAEFSLDPRTVQEIASPTPRPLVYTFGSEVFAVLHFPVNRQTHSDAGTYEQEVNFIVGSDFLITVRYDTIDTIHRFSKRADVDAAINHKETPTNGAHIFISILHTFYQSADDELRFLEDWTDEIETRIFSGDEKDMVESLSEVTRILINFRKTLSLHTEPLRDLKEAVR